MGCTDPVREKYPRGIAHTCYRGRELRSETPLLSGPSRPICRLKNRVLAQSFSDPYPVLIRPSAARVAAVLGGGAQAWKIYVREDHRMSSIRDWSPATNPPTDARALLSVVI